MYLKMESPTPNVHMKRFLLIYITLMYLVNAHRNGTELCPSLIIYWVEVYEKRKLYLPTGWQNILYFLGAWGKKAPLPFYPINYQPATGPSYHTWQSAEIPNLPN